MAEYDVTTCDPTIAKLEAAINSHDPDQVAASFTADYQCSVPLHPSRSFTGNDHVRANWVMMLGRVPNIRATVLRALPDAASGLTWSEWEMTGSTREGDPVTFRGVVISTARDGKIASTRFYIDELTDR